MPQAALTFNLPEETEEHADAINGTAWKSVACDLDQQLRTWLKHGHDFATGTFALENARQRLHDLIDEHGLTL